MKAKKILQGILVYALLSSVAWFIAYVVSPEKGLMVFNIASGSFSKTIKIILGVFMIVAFIQVYIKPEHMKKIFGKEAGVRGILLASIIPIVLGGSLITVLPLLKTLKDKGASYGVLFAFITSWSGKAPLIPLEIEYLGLNFAIIRIISVIVIALIFGFIGDCLMEKRRR